MASTQSPATAAPSSEGLDLSYLQSLWGYNARRAALTIMEASAAAMEPFGLRPVSFSVMSVITHNPGITSRQLCAVLNLLPPNLVGLIQQLAASGLLVRRPHPDDGRAMGLHATAQGQELMQRAEAAVVQTELDHTAQLSDDERATLLRLLQKIYL